MSSGFNNKQYILKLFGLGFLLGGLSILIGHFVNDEPMYRQIARHLLDGKIMYKHVVDNKPPLIYYTYALFFWIFHILKSGLSYHFIVKIISIIAHVFTPYLVYVISRELFNKRTAKIAGLISVITLFSGYYKDFLCANTETYMNVFALTGLLFFVKNRFSFKWYNLFFSGIFLSIAFLYRLQVGVYLILFFVIIVFYNKRKCFWKSIARLSYIGIGFLIPISITVLYFYQNNGLFDLYYWIFKWNSIYIKIGMQGNLILRFIKKFSVLLAGQYSHIILGVCAIVLIFKTSQGRISFKNLKIFKSRKHAFLIYFFILALITYFVGARFYGHYFVQTLPPLSILAGYYLSIYLQKRNIRSINTFRKYLKENGSKQKTKLITYLIVFILPVFVFFSLHFYLGVKRQIKYIFRKKITSNNSKKKITVRKYLNKQFPGVNPVFVWTEDVYIYRRLQRKPATRFLFLNYQMGRIWGTKHKSGTPEMNRKVELKKSWEMLFDDFNKYKPKLFIAANKKRTKFIIEKYPRLNEYLKNNFEFVITVQNYEVYKRKSLIKTK